MTNPELGYFLGEYADITEGDNGFWRLQYKGRELLVVTDEGNNRMRIMTAVRPEWKVKKRHHLEMLKAQFHKLLDVKYAIYNGMLWSLFMHPLAQLTREQLPDALSQVYWAAENFGTSYNSSDLEFGAGDDG